MSFYPHLTLVQGELKSFERVFWFVVSLAGDYANLIEHSTATNQGRVGEDAKGAARLHPLYWHDGRGGAHTCFHMVSIEL